MYSQLWSFVFVKTQCIWSHILTIGKCFFDRFKVLRNFLGQKPNLVTFEVNWDVNNGSHVLNWDTANNLIFYCVKLFPTWMSIIYCSLSRYFFPLQKPF